MKKVIALIFLFLLFITTKAQVFYWVATPIVLSQNAADVKAIVSVTLANWTTIRSHSVSVDNINKKVNLVSCYLYNYINTATSFLTDTVDIGPLNTGNYNLNYTVFISNSYPNCTPIDTTINSYPFYSFPTNIKKFSDNRQFEISPNPAKEYFKIITADNSAVTKVEIINILSDKVLEINEPTSNNDIDISSLAKGFYLVNIYTDKYSFIKKIIIE